MDSVGQTWAHIADATPSDAPHSPFTRLNREHWVATADLILDGAWRYSSGSLLCPPGKASVNGRLSDGLEGFARTFLLAGFRIRGANGLGVQEFIARYAEGVRIGTDQRASNRTGRWPSIIKTRQARVEAASVALGLALTRPWIWDQFDQTTREQVYQWLRPGLEQPPYNNNWHLFTLVIAGFLRSVGKPSGTAEAIDRALARIDQWYDGAGWYSDGPGRAYDSYNGLALHFYPVLYAYLFQDDDVMARYGPRLAEFLETYALLFDSSGAPVFQGRSLTYRFAPVGALWLGQLTGYTSLEPGQTRRIASGSLRHFFDAGAFSDGYMPLGWFAPGDMTIQPYSGPASPHWMSKAFAALLLPAGHPEWRADERPAPIEVGDYAVPMGRSGLLGQGTSVDGIARIHNHGSDKHSSRSAAITNDDPLYSQGAYSTRTAPATDSPYSNAFGLLIGGRMTERGPMTPLGQGPGWAASRQTPQRRRRWLGSPRMDFPEFRRHLPAVDAVPGVTIDYITCARTHLEVRIWRVRGAAGQVFQVSGWPISHRVPAAVDITRDNSGAKIASSFLATFLHNYTGFTDSAEVTTQQRTPFGEYITVPTLSGPCVTGDQVFVAVAALFGPGQSPDHMVEVTTHSDRVDIAWPDATTQSVSLLTNTADSAR